jgi:hypothetical protein
VSPRCVGFRRSFRGGAGLFQRSRQVTSARERFLLPPWGLLLQLRRATYIAKIERVLSGPNPKPLIARCTVRNPTGFPARKIKRTDDG